MGTRLKDIIFDRHEDHLYEDEKAMRLTPYVMAERCLQVEAVKIYDDITYGVSLIALSSSYNWSSCLSKIMSFNLVPIRMASPLLF